ncbi:hypothetical protein [Conexibacter sp. DBS9H8]|uniref:hypothetical protein n=1 Tax=Conexibacter sp. DBS9H8 TaxID=2937801 RepID=UPI00200BC1A2|nr:hypothetical protein [Conexibacter sp. DBS9H8]
MAQNFIAVDRDQAFLLLPPSLREWLPEGHLAWCLLVLYREANRALLRAEAIS